MKISVNEFRKNLKKYLNEEAIEIMLYNKKVGEYRSCTTNEADVVQDTQNVVQDYDEKLEKAREILRIAEEKAEPLGVSSSLLPESDNEVRYIWEDGESKAITKKQWLGKRKGLSGWERLPREEVYG